jgi:hypothetical protein
MATPNLLAGNLFRLLRGDGASPEVFTFVCIANSARGLTYTNEFEDATVPDCTVPTSIPSRKSVIRSTQWGITFSGIVDALLFAPIRTDAGIGVTKPTAPRNYQFIVDKNLANGGGTYTGAIWFETVAQTETNNGFVSFTATCRGDGDIIWAPAAA